ncbi:MAG: hypothetical protein JST59_29330 [Actinobacteria bacterium]|nr:hypothetical protein [Actinomycetota bacterium]
MDLRWLRLRRGQGKARRRRPKLSAESAPILDGPRVVIERLDSAARSREAVVALGALFEVTDVDGDGRRFEVILGHCSYADEAVVRLASELDDIDRDWQLYLSWPRSLDG